MVPRNLTGRKPRKEESAMDGQYSRTIGFDLGDTYSHVCRLDEAGEVVERSRVRTRRAEVKERFSGYPPSRVAIEVGTHSPWVSRLLQECGHEVLVANSSKLRMIYANAAKSDRVDAESLARVARMDPKLLHPIRHRGESGQAELAVLRGRDALVRTRTTLVNHVRGAVKSFGERLPKCSADSFGSEAAGRIPKALREALRPVVQVIAELTRKIKAYDKRVEAMCEKAHPETQRLRQIKGVGPVTSLAFVLTVGDPSRFAKSRSVGSYLGLTQRRNQSGGWDPELPITKAGDGHVRRLLVGSAQYMLGPFGEDSDLRRWGLSLMETGVARGQKRKRAKKRAVVAVGRKLGVLMHHLWTTGDTYEPLYQAKRRVPEVEEVNEAAVLPAAPLPSPQGGEATARTTGREEKRRGARREAERPSPVSSPG